MIDLRELTAMPDMPLWVRVLLAASGGALLVTAAYFALPLADLSWGRGVFALVVAVVGVDLVIGAARRRSGGRQR